MSSANFKYDGPASLPLGVGCLFLALAFMVFAIGLFIAAVRWAF